MQTILNIRKPHLSHCQQELLSSTTNATTAGTTAAMTSTEATGIAFFLVLDRLKETLSNRLI
jgi:hypothetical protein